MTSWKKCLVALICSIVALGCAATGERSRDDGQGSPSEAGPSEIGGGSTLATAFSWGLQVREQRLQGAGCKVGERCGHVCQQAQFPYYCGYGCADSPARCERKHEEVLPGIHWFSASTGAVRAGERWSVNGGIRHLSDATAFSDLPTHRVPKRVRAGYDAKLLRSISVGHELFLELGVRHASNGPEKISVDVGIVSPPYLFGKGRSFRAPEDGCYVTTLTFERTRSGQESQEQSVHVLIPPDCARLAEEEVPLNFAVRVRAPGYGQIEGQTVSLPHDDSATGNFRAQLADSPVLWETIFRNGNPCYRRRCPVFSLLPGTVGDTEIAYNPKLFPKSQPGVNHLSLLLDPDPLTNSKGVMVVRTDNDGENVCRESAPGAAETPLFTVSGVMVPLGYGGEEAGAHRPVPEVSFGQDPVRLHYEICAEDDVDGEDCVTLPFKGVPHEEDAMACLNSEGDKTQFTEPDECLRHDGYVWTAEDPAAQSFAYLKKVYVDEGTRFRHRLFLNGGDSRACEQLVKRGFQDGRKLSLRMCATRPRLGLFDDQTLSYRKQLCSSTQVSLVSDESAVRQSYGDADGLVEKSKLSGQLGSLFVTTASVAPRQVQTVTRASTWFEPTAKGLGTLAALFYGSKAFHWSADKGVPEPKTLAGSLTQGGDTLKAYAALAGGLVLPFVDVSGEVYTGTKTLRETPEFDPRERQTGDMQQSMRFYYGALGYLDTAVDWQGHLNEEQRVKKSIAVDLVSILSGIDNDGMPKGCLTWHLWHIGYPGSIGVCPWVKVGALVDMGVSGVSGEPDADHFYPEAHHSGTYDFLFAASVGAGVTLKLNVLDVKVVQAGVAGDLTALKVNWGERTGLNWGIWDGAMHVHPLETTMRGAGSIRYFDGKAYVYVETPVLTLWRKDLWSFQGAGHSWEHFSEKSPDTVVE